jgi:metallo-beta-lactamase class B
MKFFVTVLGASCLILGSGVTTHAQSADTIAAQVAAAQKAGGETWLSLQSELCGPAQATAARFPLITQTRPAEKIFDNLYVLSNNDVLAWAIVTSAGIILIDTTYDRTVKDVIVDSMQKAGLDPAQIKYIFLTHKNTDHAGGAKYLQDTYGAHVLLSEVDWEDLLAQPARGRGPASPVPPKKDMVIADGQKLTLGDETITFYLTPGSTRGTVSALIPVKDKGTLHLAAFWGSNVIGVTSPHDALVAFGTAARRFEGIAASAGADVLLTNHERYIDLNQKLFSMRANPAGPHPFIVGATRVRNYMQVLDHCTQALALASDAKK